MKIQAPKFKTKLKAMKWMLHHFNNEIDFGKYEIKYFETLLKGLIYNKNRNKIDLFIRQQWKNEAKHVIYLAENNINDLSLINNPRYYGIEFKISSESMWKYSKWLETNKFIEDII